MTSQTQLILVTGTDAAQREIAVAAALAQLQTDADQIAVILEGLPSGSSSLDFPATANLPIVRIASGCVCCMGNLTLQVTLNRILRRNPRYIVLAVASTEHLDRLRTFLAAPPYTTLLQLAQEVRA